MLGALGAPHSAFAFRCAPCKAAGRAFRAAWQPAAIPRAAVRMVFGAWDVNCAAHSFPAWTKVWSLIIEVRFTTAALLDYRYTISAQPK
jgi:hypothetical protein